jgi:hypothetical protein
VLTLPVVEIVLRGEAAAVRLVERGAREYASALIADLDLPARAVVRAEVVRVDVGAGRLTLTIAGQAAPLALADDALLDESVAMAIYRHRRHLLTGDVVRAFAATSGQRIRFSSNARAKLHEAMSLCVDRDLSLRRLASRLQKVGATDWDPWDVVLAVHGDDSLRLTVSFWTIGSLASDRQVMSRHFEQNAANMQQAFFEATGLLTPLPAIEFKPELGIGEGQPTLNDVRLPVRRVNAAPLADLLAIVHTLLVEEPATLLTREGVARALNFLDDAHPELVHEVSTLLGLNTLCRILTALAKEKVSLRKLDEVLDALTHPITTHDVDSRYDVYASPVEIAVRSPATDLERYVRAVRSRLN